MHAVELAGDDAEILPDAVLGMNDERPAANPDSC